MDGYSQFLQLSSPLDRFRLPGLGGRPQSLVPDANSFADAQPVGGEADTSFLGNLMESSLGGLAYVGKSLGKAFGGRAILGALGGRPDELLSVIPFSDTLGITDENRAVQGTDITDNVGLTNAGDDGFMRQALGFGAEVLLDPATYLTGGAKTAAGALLKSSQRAPDLASAIRAGEKSLLGVGLPFSPPAFNVGTGELAARIAESNPLRAVGTGVEKLTGGYVNPYTFGAKVLEPVGRYARSLFDTDVAGATTRVGQQIAENTYTPALRYGGDLNTVGAADNVIGGYSLADQEYAKYVSDLLPLVKPFEPQAGDVLRGLRQQAEGFGPDAAASFAAAGISPADAAQIAARTDQFADLVRGGLQARQELGIPVNELQDDFAKYFPREANDIRPTGGGLTDYFRGRSAAFSTVDDAAKKRAAELKNVPGGTVGVNALFADPALRQMNPLQLQAELRQRIAGTATPPAGSPVWGQAEDLAGRILNSSDQYTKGTNFFNDDVASQGLKGMKGGAKGIASAKAVYELLDPKYKQVATVAEFEKAGTPYRTVSELLRDAKLTLEDANSPGKLVSEFIAANKTGLKIGNPNDLNQLKNIAVPEDVAADILKLGRAWNAPKELAPIVAAWDWATNLFKSSVTTLFPAFHTRNGVSALFNMWRDDALSLPAMRDGVAILRGGTVESAIPGMANLTPAERTKRIVEELVGNKVAFVKESRVLGDLATAPAGPSIFKTEFPEAGGVARPLSQDLRSFAGGFAPERGKLGEQLNPLNQVGVNRTEDTFIPVKQGRKVGTAIEDFARASHYIALRSQGIDPVVAAERVKKYHIDYCVDEKTQALTDCGWKGIDDLTVGDRLLTINPVTLEMEWNEAEAVNIFDSPGHINLWTTTTFSAATTGAHKWLAEGSGVRGGRPESRAAKTHFTTTDEINSTAKRLVTSGGAPVNRDTDSPFSDEFVELVGWFLTEGWVEDGDYGILVSQSESHNPEFVERIRRIADYYKKCGAKSVEYAPRNCGYGPIITWRFGKGIGELVRAAAPDKQLTTEFVNLLSSGQQQLLLDTLMRGDGTITAGGSQVFTQKCDARSEGFQYLCSVLGYRSNLRKKGDINHVTIYKKGLTYTSEMKKEAVEYRGRVWCPTTRNHTWMARRDGITYWTGNSDMTQFEQNVMKRLAPWYAFSRKSLPPLLEDLVTKPAKVAASVRLTTGVREPGEFVPQYVGEGAAIPVPGAPEGQQRYISSFGLPFEDELVKTIGSLGQGDVKRAAQQFFGMAQPWIKTPAEVASGVQFYSGRRLEDLKPYESISAMGLLPEDRARQLTQVIANTPASRAFSSLDKLIDERKGLGPTAVNLLTGGRVTDVDIQKQQDIATRELLKELLRGQSGVRAREDVYVPADKLGLLDPAELQLYANLKAVEKRVNQRRQ